MKLGIIGKPQAGKTTVFNAACGQQGELVQRKVDQSLYVTHLGGSYGQVGSSAS